MQMERPDGLEGRCPYGVLEAVGITPQSSMKEVQDASFELMEEDRWVPETRAAWNELRMIERRLIVDFLCDGAGVPTEGSQAKERVLDALLGRLDAGVVEYDR